MVRAESKIVKTQSGPQEICRFAERPIRNPFLRGQVSMVPKPFDARARSFLLLAPSRRAVPSGYEMVDTDPRRHQRLMAEMQRLRGRIYLEDGAIAPDQLSGSRHQLEVDEGSWHLLIVDQHERVCGCARYREYPNTASYNRLTVARSALARCRDHGHRLKKSVNAELELARRLDLPYVELGGWALDISIRGTSDALRMAMSTYALSQSLGGGVGVSTVTQRHSSSSILRRLGGRVFEWDGAELPPYYDPEYRCGMEVLKFYSWSPNPRYEDWVVGMKSALRRTPVVCGGGPSAWQPPAPGQLALPAPGPS